MKGSGRAAAAKPDIVSLREASRKAREIIENDLYQASLLGRAINNELHPSVEVMLWERAYGKTPEQINVNVSTDDLEGLSTEQLAEQAVAIAQEIARAKTLVASGRRDAEQEIPNSIWKTVQ